MRIGYIRCCGQPVLIGSTPVDTLEATCEACGKCIEGTVDDIRDFYSSAICRHERGTIIAYLPDGWLERCQGCNRLAFVDSQRTIHPLEAD